MQKIWKGKRQGRKHEGAGKRKQEEERTWPTSVRGTPSPCALGPQPDSFRAVKKRKKEETDQL